MNNIGMSLPWDYLCSRIITREAVVLGKNFGSAPEFLNFLRDLGVQSIELRHRHKTLNETDMYRSIETVLYYDMALTIHGDTLPDPGAFNYKKLFPWYKAIDSLYKKEKKNITVTFHPIINDTNEDVSAQNTSKTLSLIANQDLYPSFSYALENQRSKGEVDPGITFDGVVHMVSNIPDNPVGICWDMGHSYSNVINFGHALYPPKEFLKRVIHTHIHDIGPTGRTHWPFKENRVPLKENIELLKEHEYQGIYNLELSFDRFAEEKNIMKLVTGSIKILRELT